MKLTDDELWLIRDALSNRIDRGDFYSTDEYNNEDQYDSFLEKETIELYDKLIEGLK
jgi:hypothetical protein